MAGGNSLNALDARKPVFKLISAFVFRVKESIIICYRRNFNCLADETGFESRFVGNPEDRISSAIGTYRVSGRVLDSRPRGRWFEPHRRHCVVVHEQDTFILA